jgi:3-dehydroquinate synthase
MTESRVFLSDNPASWLNQFLSQKRYSSITVLVDDQTATHCYPLIRTVLPTHHIVQIPSGEEFKNLATCTLIWQKLTDRQVDRHGLMIILGGGVLGDLAGFCAATFKRGIDFLLIPTTLLAQVDASVGGKLGIDFNHFKNHIGVFQLPIATLVAPAFLKTLPLAEMRSGFAEVIKHALIDSLEAWKATQVQSWEKLDWKDLIQHSIQLKEAITRKDPTEKGLRKVLNLGHTIGHAIETASLETNQRLLHGEAVAIGLIMEAFISHQKGWLAKDDLTQITTYILGIFEKNGSELVIEAILKNVFQDKKNRSNRILAVLLKEIGKPEWDVEITAEEIQSSWEYYLSA